MVDGRTALHYAAWGSESDPEMARLLPQLLLAGSRNNEETFKFWREARVGKTQDVRQEP